MSSGKDEIIQFVSFTLGSEEYGIEIEKVKEIVRIPEISEIPDAPPVIEGVINLRGEVIPVINLRQRFDIQGEFSGESSRVIIIDVDSKFIGLIVDAVSQVLRINTADIDPVEEINNVTEEYIKGVGKISDRLIIWLDIEKILSSKEKIEIQSLHKQIKENL